MVDIGCITVGKRPGSPFISNKIISPVHNTWFHSDWVNTLQHIYLKETTFHLNLRKRRLWSNIIWIEILYAAIVPSVRTDNVEKVDMFTSVSKVLESLHEDNHDGSAEVRNIILPCLNYLRRLLKLINCWIIFINMLKTRNLNAIKTLKKFVIFSFNFKRKLVKTFQSTAFEFRFRKQTQI